MSAQTTCCATVIRKGIEEPCEKPAVGMVRVRTSWGLIGNPWPACAWHLNRAGEGNAVTLDELRPATTGPQLALEAQMVRLRAIAGRDGLLDVLRTAERTVAAGVTTAEVELVLSAFTASRRTLSPG